MKLGRTLSSLCVACVLAPLLRAAPATQPNGSLTETEQLRQRIAQLEAEVASLRARLDQASKPDAIKSNLTLRDELKLDYVPPAPAPPRDSSIHFVRGTLEKSGQLIISGTGTTSSPTNVPMTQKRILQRPPGDLIDDRQPQKP